MSNSYELVISPLELAPTGKWFLLTAVNEGNYRT